MKPRVIMVHGINSAGRWQQEIRRVLEPHFECVDIRYCEYGSLGFLALLLEPHSLLLLLLAFYALALVGGIKGDVLFLVSGAFLTIASGRAVLQRRRVLDRFERDLSEEVRSSPLIHLIAHDFGTYLAGSALMRPPVRFQKVILAGAVLPTWYDWSRILRVNPGAFRWLRNEVGQGDGVTWLAYVLLSLCRGLGCSGVLGFRTAGAKGSGGVEVHTVDSAYGDCPLCSERRDSLPGGEPGETQATAPIIHNVRVQERTRRDDFIQIDYAETFWLPYLWGIEPQEFQDWLRDCSVVAELTSRNPEDPDLRLAEDELCNRPWSFLGKSLSMEIFDRVSGADTSAVEYGLLLTCQVVDEALKERDREVPRERVLQALRPQEAIRRAVARLQARLQE